MGTVIYRESLRSDEQAPKFTHFLSSDRTIPRNLDCVLSDNSHTSIALPVAIPRQRSVVSMASHLMGPGDKTFIN